MRPVGVLVVGAGPAGLAAAIRAKRALAAAASEAAVVVVDKAPKAGYHSLSGALLEPACLDGLVPGWREEKSFFVERLDPIERDGMYFLTPRRALPIPHLAVPRPMHHAGNVSISMAHFVEFLSRQAEKLGVEIYYGYSVSRLIVEEGKVAGVRLVEAGLNKEGEPKPNYLPPEEIRAPVTVIADGSRGVLSTEYRELFGGGPNPQVYSIGLKAVYRFAKESPFGRGRAVHTLGFPAPRNVFGGGFIYSMGESQTAVGLILGLDWPCGDLSPYAAFEAFKSHPRVAAWLEGGVPVATGARTIPEGGYYALARLHAPGALVAGDGAGFVNMEKIKGIHYAVLTGGAAGETAAAAFLDRDFSEERLAEYAKRIDALGLTAEFKRAKNYRQVFQWGLYLGTPLSMVQRLIPFRIPIRADADSLRRKRHMQLKPADGLDQAAFVGLSGTRHREDEPSHVRILDAGVCEECERNYFCACAHFCPGQVYRRSADKIILSPSNCLHCGTCADKCPFRNIRWQAPEGGEGPRFRQL